MITVKKGKGPTYITATDQPDSKEAPSKEIRQMQNPLSFQRYDPGEDEQVLRGRK